MGPLPGFKPACASARAHLSLFFSLPRGMTEVTGGVGRSDGTDCLGALVSFFGFLLIFSLRCSLPMVNSSFAGPLGVRHIQILLWWRRVMDRPVSRSPSGHGYALLAQASVQRSESMPQACPRTPITARLQLPAGIRPPFIDTASHALADAARQGRASRRCVIGPAQAAGAVCHFNGQPVGDAAAVRG